MQIMIDLLQERPAALRLAAQLLIDHANMIEAAERNVPAGTTAPAPPAPPAFVPPAFAQPPQPEVPPPPSNIVPFVPPAPPASVVTVPAANTVNTTTAPTIAAQPNAQTTSPAPVLAPLELDQSGMPWDARIHQKTKAKKKDGTWKLQKNIDQNLVIAVTQENHARMINSTAPSVSTPAPAGASAPVSLPQGAQNAAPQSNVPPPPPPSPEQIGTLAHENAQAQIYTQGVPQAPPIPQGSQAPVIPSIPPVHVPPAPDVGVPDASQPTILPVSEYRALVQKITAARTAGKLSAEEVNQIVAGAGAPSFQMLANMAHLVPIANDLLDAILVTR